MGARPARFEGDGAAQVIERRPVLAQVGEHDAEVGEGFRIVGGEPHRLLEVAPGVLDKALGAQDRGQVAVRGGERRLELDGAPVAGQRLLDPPGVEADIAQVGMGGGELGIVVDGAPVTAFGLDRAAARHHHVAEVGVHLGVLGAQLERPLVEPGRLVEVAQLAHQCAEVAQRVGVGRVVFQHLMVERRGRVGPPRLVMGKGGGEGIEELGHGRAARGIPETVNADALTFL